MCHFVGHHNHVNIQMKKIRSVVLVYAVYNYVLFFTCIVYYYSLWTIRRLFAFLIAFAKFFRLKATFGIKGYSLCI